MILSKFPSNKIMGVPEGKPYWVVLEDLFCLLTIQIY